MNSPNESPQEKRIFSLFQKAAKEGLSKDEKSELKALLEQSQYSYSLKPSNK